MYKTILFAGVAAALLAACAPKPAPTPVYAETPVTQEPASQGKY